jgi:anti-sigma regulatory factor (Ser/Thr protein kinase)
VSAVTSPCACGTESYRHEALFYAGIDGFLEGIVPFLRQGVRAGEPVLVVVSARKIALLRAALGDDAGHVRFADMAEVGANPARIIPAWREFVSEHAGRPMRGVGEPIYPERSDAEMTECHRHEALLNLAFADTPGFRLLCPYDTTALPETVIREASRTHPHLLDGAEPHPSPRYAGDEAIAAPFDDPLPKPTGAFGALAFETDTLGEVRRYVAEHAEPALESAERVEDLVLAVSEIATNSVRHGGGTGVLRVWTDGDTLVCEIRDRGAIIDPLAGRVVPAAAQLDGRGLWLANQVCDLVQVRAFADGGVVRLHMRR